MRKIGKGGGEKEEEIKKGARSSKDKKPRQNMSPQRFSDVGFKGSNVGSKSRESRYFCGC